MTGTDLYRRMCAFNYGDAERAAVMREVWDPTPWMVEIYTGQCGDERDREMQRWCHDEFGGQSWPLHGRPARWLRGSATVHGWTWYGFADQAGMGRFVAHWPAPEGVRQPDTAPAG